MEYVIGLPNDDFPAETIDKLNAALGLTDPEMAGTSIMKQRTAYVSHVEPTCVYHWSFAPSSLWSGEARFQQAIRAEYWLVLQGGLLVWQSGDNSNVLNKTTMLMLGLPCMY